MKKKRVKRAQPKWHNLNLPGETFAAIEALAGLLAIEDPIGEKPAKCRTVAIAVREAIARRKPDGLVQAIAGEEADAGDAVVYAGEKDGLPIAVRAAGPKRKPRTPKGASNEQ